MKHLFTLLTGGILLLSASGCDDISSPPGSDSAILQSLDVQPGSVDFNSGSAEDSTVTISLLLITEGPAENDLVYSLTNRGESLAEGTFSQESENTYSAEFPLTLSSSLSTNLTIYAFESENTSGQLIRGSIPVSGFTSSPPFIADAFNTEQVILPETGRERIDFFARVIHPDNQQLIDRVLYFLIDQQGNRIGNEFEMYDDGVSDEAAGRIDETASDSLYSSALFVESTNSPNIFSVFYYALGRDGQSSDTLQTELRIIE